VDNELLEGRLRHATLRLRARTDLPLAFSGSIVGGRELALGNFAGATVGALKGVHLAAGFGLGGRVMTMARPMSVDDYVSSTSIRHMYDEVISAEGLHAMIAVPVVVRRTPVAVLYAAARAPMVFAGRMLATVAEEARELEQQLAVDSALRGGWALAHEGDLTVEDVLDLQAELAAIASRITDPAVKADLLRACSRLTDEPGEDSTITPRERDVLMLVAQGLSNSGIAAALGLTVNTVKSYMKSVMRKLCAETRIEATVIARRSRIIP